MTEVKVTHDYKASADQVWQKIRSFAGLADWLPGITCEATDGGKSRKLTMPGGATIIEALEMHDDANRTYGYKIVQSPQPVKNYHSVIKVVPKGSGSTVEWTSTFEPIGPEALAKGMMEGIYKTALGALALAVGG
jgi:hypothetical protein